MRVRSQLVLALSLLAAFTIALLTVVYFLGARDILFRQIQSTVLSIASTAAQTVDVAKHEQIVESGDEQSPAYADVRDQLRKLRDANRRDDVNVRFLYTMRPRPDGTWMYVVDAEEDGDDHSVVGDPVEFEDGDVLSADKPHVDGRFSRDEFGTWLSGTAPLRDASGHAVALLGVDVAAGDVSARLNHLLIAGLVAGTIALIAAAALAWLIASWFTRPLARISSTLAKIGDGDLDARVEMARTDEFGELANAVNSMATTLRERNALKRALARYVSREVAEEVLAGGEPDLKGARKEVTVLIADIRNFTAMSEMLPPEALVSFLNRFFGRLIDAIFANRGTLDKFLGDGCLAIFGAPVDDPDHHRLAVAAACQMLDSMHELAADLQREHGIAFRMGIALHAGPAIVGNVGSEDRIEYTAIGDTVNVASRVEALNKQYGTELLMTESVVKGAGNGFAFREVGETSLRGVSAAVKIYTLS